MDVEIITIGDELLIGQVVDTNSAWMGYELNQAGFSVSRITSISDNESDILKTLEESTKRSPIVLITGGLGPTRDDITKTTLCKFFNTRLVFSEEIYSDIVELLSKRIRHINQLSREQALVPENCDVIRNPVGTAPVMWFNHSGGVVVSMPGVPSEMQYSMSENIIPRLIKRFRAEAIIHKTIHVYNVPESVLAEKLTDWENSLPKFIKLAYLPAFGKIRLRLTGKGDDARLIESTICKLVEELYPIIGDNIYGFDEETAHESLLELLKKKNATIGCAESCSGGYIAHLITSVSGASQCFNGGIVAYSNQMKVNLLNVSNDDLLQYGAVSKQVVEQMALGACETLGTNYSIAASGIAGPTGGTPEKPVGTVWIAWAGNGKVISEMFQFGNIRERTIVRTAETAIIKMKLLIDRELI